MSQYSPPVRWYRYYLVAACTGLVFVQYLILAAQPKLLAWATWIPEPVAAAFLAAVNLMVFLPILMWLYENHLWKMFGFRKYDFSGVWRYTNTYYDGSPQTTGFVVITQTAIAMAFQEGVSAKNNPWRTRWESIAVKLDAEGKAIFLSYRSERKLDHDSKSVRKRSLEEIKVHDYEVPNGFWGHFRGRRPIYMKSEFWNCIDAPVSELAAANSSGNPSRWIPTLGETELRRATFQELEEARQRYRDANPETDGIARQHAAEGDR